MRMNARPNIGSVAGQDAWVSRRTEQKQLNVHRTACIAAFISAGYKQWDMIIPTSRVIEIKGIIIYLPCVGKESGFGIVETGFSRCSVVANTPHLGCGYRRFESCYLDLLLAAQSNGKTAGFGPADPGPNPGVAVN